MWDATHIGEIPRFDLARASANLRAMAPRSGALIRPCSAVVAALVMTSVAHAAEPAFVPAPELLAAARREGKIVLYTANFLDTEQAVLKRFSQRFGIQLEIVRAPTGSLITRVKTEAAANKMIADVIDISDRVQARQMIELFAP